MDEQQVGSELNPEKEEQAFDRIFGFSYGTELQKIKSIQNECAKIIVGQEEVINKLIICLISDGHVLLEGVPGIAKTLSARVLSKTIQADFSRIQFTPDLMPSDIIGTSIFDRNDSSFSFKKGPIFSNVILIDEINRAPAKTQSALFEVMEEKQITYDGMRYEMSSPFFVIATQNPIDQEGTYRLPEAQLDRFMMKIGIEYPSYDEELAIMKRFKSQVGALDFNQITAVLSPEELKQLKETVVKIKLEDQMLEYIANIVQDTRNSGLLQLGASPRASLAIMRACKAAALLAGRDFVVPDDIQYVARDILSHRVLLSPDSEMAGRTAPEIINEIIKNREVPR